MMNHIQLSKEKKHLFELFIGGEKSGKTTCLLKYAYELKKKKKKVVILSLCEKSAEELKQHAQNLEVPFGMINKSSDWLKAYERLKKFDCVLIDCPSYDLEQESDYMSLKSLLPPEKLKYTLHLVQSLKEKEKKGFKRTYAYKTLFSFDDFIFSHLDQSHNYGMIFNFQRHFQTPLCFFSSSPHLSHSFEVATKEKLISLIFEWANFKRNFLAKNQKSVSL